MYKNGEKELYNLNLNPYQLKSRHDEAGPDLKSRLGKRISALDGCAGRACRTAEGPLEGG
jgi:hypothetical protein